MLFVPKSRKFKKSQKGRVLNKINTNISFLNFTGVVGLKSLETGRVSSKQLLAAKQAINKIIKKTGKVITTVFPQHPVSKKPKEIRMGKGKGAVDHWVCKITAGSFLFELKTKHSFLSLIALRAAQIRLPIKTKIII